METLHPSHTTRTLSPTLDGSHHASRGPINQRSQRRSIALKVAQLSLLNLVWTLRDRLPTCTSRLWIWPTITSTTWESLHHLHELFHNLRNALQECQCWVLWSSKLELLSPTLQHGLRPREPLLSSVPWRPGGGSGVSNRPAAAAVLDETAERLRLKHVSKHLQSVTNVSPDKSRS